MFIDWLAIEGIAASTDPAGNALCVVFHDDTSGNISGISELLEICQVFQ
jgi:hypothetical protein